MSNPFQSTDPWEVSLDTILPPGNHVVKIVEAEGGTSSGGHPEIVMKLQNEHGSIRDWLQITQGTISKVVGLAQAVGIPVPGEGEFDQSTLRIADEWIFRLKGRSVGVVLREEPAYNKETGMNDPTKTRTRVQGYVTPQRVAQSISNGQTFRGQQSQPTADIPF